MATKIRLKRIGRRNKPFYRVVVMDSRKKRDGASIEELGWYNPIAGKSEQDYSLKEDRYYIGSMKALRLQILFIIYSKEKELLINGIL